MTDIVVMETSKGTIEIELNRGRAPGTVKNFVDYTNDGFFNGLCFHRVIRGFMIQGGGFTPAGQHKDGRDPIQIESRNGLKNARGTIAMARTNDPDSASSQFFINTADNANLDYPNPDGHGYTVFGKVISGLEVVDEIERASTWTKMSQHGPMQDWPSEEICIDKVSMK
ncbi:peptidyl-prolyl cis-trans isomerase [Candidatus Bathyarchaeota archaeon]|mgnify:FL=1|jgi:peptidyl-prolyl cis-trans isomerase A (cyclophilin A)|nr:peptidyl-prolyl cis-trans isomerase [Candidatus Bathyarchaeota archaeon]MBT4319873.1 peptidyl-prolyl cis-trans isomerase [Candidatus Bathyarchaeota archaeon]MBT4423971.1 peptidyl-prolyl cis-trans isomerase [Candidatus Bathyarchaeota archaeon]MBT5642009.1 peptidyl-prolyl cis-trans isomerase [Candidatus Bathyarchaeota archaeon]MBT7186508.1 peptidyl-prolyl cis-trans isomerase [Candidatus Bathyarchaeota archaeon]